MRIVVILVKMIRLLFLYMHSDYTRVRWSLVEIYWSAVTRGVLFESHHNYKTSAGPRWFWECCSSGWTSVHFPGCCPWKGTPSRCMSSQTGTSLKQSSKEGSIKLCALTSSTYPSVKLRAPEKAAREYHPSDWRAFATHTWEQMGFPDRTWRAHLIRKEARLHINRAKFPRLRYARHMQLRVSWCKARPLVWKITWVKTDGGWGWTPLSMWHHFAFI